MFWKCKKKKEKRNCECLLVVFFIHFLTKSTSAQGDTSLVSHTICDMLCVHLIMLC